MSNIMKTVSELKISLAKEIGKEGNSERCSDILNQLNAIEDMSLQILSETLIGTVVSKFKSHSDPDIGANAKALVKKWKQLAKKAGVGKGAPSKSTLPGMSTMNSRVATLQPKSVARKITSTSTSVPDKSISTTEFDHLPGLRKNIAKKFHQTFGLSTGSLNKSGIHMDAIESLTISRAAEVEISCHDYSKGNKQSYQDKIRSLIFNLKKNEELRENIILGHISSETLVKMPKQELATAERSDERNKTVERLRGSRRLDWEQANEDKINEMCGIKDELLQASLFTCGRCKSIKTTSTQKQTRSADEPMTVFVFCLNCGKRWKC